ncbi:serine/threonine-protein kinase BLUS1 [Nymphaea colorata]|nr:serine/threonine-protein kinase BLUS1 [Nymphaea colorata]
MALEPKVTLVTAKAKVTYPVDPSAYELLSVIGHGVSAVVYKAKCLPMRTTVAIKTVDLEHSPSLNLDSLRRETQTMALLSHPNLLSAHCSFIVGPSLWIVMPFMACGSLHSIMTSSFPGGLDEQVIAIVLRDTLKALDYLHRQGHVHRDIKAGNILVDSDGSIKVADFGVVSGSVFDYSSGSNLLSDITGTPYWMAPEVILAGDRQGYNYKADMWSFGITALELAHGHPPLSNLPLAKALTAKTSLRIASAESIFNEKKFSKAFKEMVAMCLVAGDPAMRPSAEKLLKHPFFKKCKSSDHLLKMVLKDLPSVEDRAAAAKGTSRIDHEEDEQDARRRCRRISGWNFNEEICKVEPVFPKEPINSNKPANVGENPDGEAEKVIVEKMDNLSLHVKPGEQSEDKAANACRDDQKPVPDEATPQTTDKDNEKPDGSTVGWKINEVTREPAKPELRPEPRGDQDPARWVAPHLHSILGGSLEQGEMVVSMMKMCCGPDDNKTHEEVRVLELWLQVQRLRVEIVKLEDEVDRQKRRNQELEKQCLKKK